MNSIYEYETLKTQLDVLLVSRLRVEAYNSC
jgi:hypothetical protein